MVSFWLCWLKQVARPLGSHVAALAVVAVALNGVTLQLKCCVCTSQAMLLVCCSSNGASKGTSSSGISGGGIFGIVVAVLLAVALAAAGIAFYVKRKNLHQRSLLRMQSSGGFSRFSDFS